MALPLAQELRRDFKQYFPDNGLRSVAFAFRSELTGFSRILTYEEVVKSLDPHLARMSVVSLRTYNKAEGAERTKYDLSSHLREIGAAHRLIEAYRELAFTTGKDFYWLLEREQKTAGYDSEVHFSGISSSSIRAYKMSRPLEGD